QPQRVHRGHMGGVPRHGRPHGRTAARHARARRARPDRRGSRRVPARPVMTHEAKVTTEYGIRYTERSAFNGREYLSIQPIGSSNTPEAAEKALERAKSTREYQ